jgi:hypothetical protein
MQIKITNKLNTNIRNAMRSCGYFENYDRQSQQTSYIRNLGRDFYPRFHIYVETKGDLFLINLHIDQKKTSYEGQNAHSGEYDTEVVTKEGQRINQIFSKMVVSQSQIESVKKEEKKGFLGRIFG